MKTIGELAQERSLTAFEDLGAIAKAPERKTPTPSAGSGTGAMIAHGTNRPQADEVQDILWKLSTIKPWQIQPDDQKAVKNALSALDWATIPATIDEAAFWLTRLLAHFPRREVTQDAIIVGDLSADMVEAGVSLIAIAATCADIRKAGNRKNPWLPPSGEILKIAQEKTEGFQLQHRRLSNPRAIISPPKPKEADKAPWSGKSFAEMSDSVRADLWAFLMPLDLDIRLTLCRVIKVDYDELKGWIDNLPPDPEGGDDAA